MTDAYREASHYETRRKREVKRHREAIARELQNHEQRLQALRAELSPAAARIVVAAEQEEEPPSKRPQAELWDTANKLDRLMDPHPEPDPNPAPDWLNKEPAPLPAGAMLEVEHKPRKRA